MGFIVIAYNKDTNAEVFRQTAATKGGADAIRREHLIRFPNDRVEIKAA